MWHRLANVSRILAHRLKTRTTNIIFHRKLADEPGGEPDPVAVKELRRIQDASISARLNLVSALLDRRDYTNPYFLSKMVETYQIDEMGTCFPKAVWDPKTLPKEDYYDALAAEFQEARERQAKTSKSTAGTQAVAATTSVLETDLKRKSEGPQAPAVPKPVVIVQGGPPRKKSKWDSAPA
eukprot:jgi/Botrbrau1/17043/Bobra.49_2s0099.1